MKLQELLKGLAEMTFDTELSGLAVDSRQVKNGYGFIALAGSVQHGMTHVEQAIANGAIVVMYDPAGKGELLAKPLQGVNLVAIPALTGLLGEIAARFYEHPSQSLCVIGITGTNGKTTCSQFLAQALDDCGVIGTMGWGSWGALQDTLNTTPDALAIQTMLKEFVTQQKKTVVIEVSSHGLQQGRVNGVAFKGALFTNLSRDHLDYHGSMEDYLAAKLKLFDWPTLDFVVLNLDDPCADEVLRHISDTVKIWGFSSKGSAKPMLETVAAKDIKHSLDGIRFEVYWQGQHRIVKTAVNGNFNLENVLAVLTVLLAMGLSLESAIERIAELKPVAGRMEKFGGHGKPSIFVDYAHSPDALDKVLAGLKEHCQNKLKLVFGCGGDRDQGKRPQMGAVAAKWADEVILTDDNPRSELPDAIIKDILSGCVSENVTVIHDRKMAIQTVIKNANESDCIVIAGKGHESYQEAKGSKLPFSDQAIVIQALLEWRV